MNSRGSCFLIFIAAAFLVGVAILGYYEISQRNAFAEGIAGNLAGIADKQATAIDDLTKLAIEQNKLNAMLTEATLRRQQAETWLVYVGIAAIAILMPVFVLLVAYTIRVTLRRSHARKDGE